MSAEVRLRRAIHREKKAIMVETRGGKSEEWVLATAYFVEDGVPYRISAKIEEKLNYLLDLGYKMVCCREHEWEW